MRNPQASSIFAVKSVINTLSLKRQGNILRGYRSRLALVGMWFPEDILQFDEMHRVSSKINLNWVRHRVPLTRKVKLIPNLK